MGGGVKRWVGEPELRVRWGTSKGPNGPPKGTSFEIHKMKELVKGNEEEWEGLSFGTSRGGPLGPKGMVVQMFASLINPPGTRGG